MSEFAPTPESHDTSTVDHRRLEVAAGRFASPITEALAEAHGEAREIDEGAARMIAHVLGRAFGRASALATFGREGEGTYEALRDEYLVLYSDPEMALETRQWIDWLGTYLVQREHPNSGRRFQNEHLPPQLDRILYRDQVDVGGQAFTVHLPGTTTGTNVRELAELLGQLDVEKDVALQDFLSLSDVNALTNKLLESFHEAFAGTYAATKPPSEHSAPSRSGRTSSRTGASATASTSNRSSGTTSCSWRAFARPTS